MPSLAEEPRSCVDTELGAGDVPPPAVKELGSSLSPLTAVRREAYILTEVFGNTAEKQTAFPFFFLGVCSVFFGFFCVGFFFFFPCNT